MYNDLFQKQSNNNFNKTSTHYDSKQKKFKSNYLNDTGKWTMKAVNDGFVDFNDYINDIKDTSTTNPSYNNKNFKITNQNSATAQPSYISTVTKQPEEFAFWGNIGEKVKNGINLVKDKFNEASNVIDDRVHKANASIELFGRSPSKEAFRLSQKAEDQATDKSNEWGLDGVWNNKADAYRHFIWNAQMARNSKIGYYGARNIANWHEFDAMSIKNWISESSSDFDYMTDDTIIKGKMNQENLMDLWNNQVGRELAHNSSFKHMSEDELFNFAYEHGLLITDANEAYEFLGISDYITDMDNWAVDTEWNLSSGNITFKNGDKEVTLRIGI